MNIKKISYYISLVTLFLIPIFPLIVENSLYFPFITGKAFYFRILIEIGFASWILLAFLDSKYRPRFNCITIAVTLFAVVTLVADLLGVNPLRSIFSNFERMEGWLVIVHMWALVMTLTGVFGQHNESKSLWHKWFNFSLIVALVVGIYGLFQYFGWAAIHQGSTRLDASLGNSAYLAVYMLYSAFLSAYLLFSRLDQGKVRLKESFRNPLNWYYAILAIFFAFIVLQTQTRGTILGLVGGIMLALLTYALFEKGKHNMKGRWISLGVLGFIVILMIAFWFNRERDFIKNNGVLGRFSNISWSEASGQARQYIWPMAVKGALERPIFGWGQENFNYIFNANYNPKMWSQEQWFDRAHSVFLDWFVASGVVGLIVYLSLYVLAFVFIWKSSLSVARKSLLTGVLAGYFVHNIFVFDNLASYFLFFSVLSYISTFKKAEAISTEKKEFSSDVVEYVVAPIVLVLLVLTVYFVNVRPLQANTRLIKALTSCASPKPETASFKSALEINSYMANQEIREQLLTCAVRVIPSQLNLAIRKEFYELSVIQIQKQIQATPMDLRIYTLGGSFFDAIQEYNKAIPLLEKAYSISPQKQSLAFEVATSYLNTGSTTKAVEVLKRAYESSPEYSQAKLSYAVALVFDSKESEARRIFGNDPEIFGSKQLAQAFIYRKEYQKAIDIYRADVDKNPKDVRARIDLAQVLYAAGRKEEAISVMRSIEKDKPELKDGIENAIKQIGS